MSEAVVSAREAKRRKPHTDDDTLKLGEAFHLTHRPERHAFWIVCKVHPATAKGTACSRQRTYDPLVPSSRASVRRTLMLWALRCGSYRNRGAHGRCESDDEAEDPRNTEALVEELSGFQPHSPEPPPPPPHAEQTGTDADALQSLLHRPAPASPRDEMGPSDSDSSSSSSDS